MSASDAHQAAYRYVLPNFRWTIATKQENYEKHHISPRPWSPNDSYKEMTVVSIKKPWNMQFKTKIFHTKAIGTLCDDEIEDDEP